MCSGLLSVNSKQNISIIKLNWTINCSCHILPITLCVILIYIPMIDKYVNRNVRVDSLSQTWFVLFAFSFLFTSNVNEKKNTTAFTGKNIRAYYGTKWPTLIFSLVDECYHICLY
jgi:quinol-cytochrome oxidoreductase complex cytochrome b subunit